MRAVLIFTFLAFLSTFTGSAAVLQANVTVDTSTPGMWVYTIENDEPSGGDNYIYQFRLSVDAPIAVSGTPFGWYVLGTDNLTYVQWESFDTAYDIAPGQSLGGFQITSAASSAPQAVMLAAWDHGAEDMGPESSGLTVLAPSAAVPEPGTALLFVGPAAALFFFRRRTS